MERDQRILIYTHFFLFILPEKKAVAEWKNSLHVNLVPVQPTLVQILHLPRQTDYHTDILHLLYFGYF